MKNISDGLFELNVDSQGLTKRYTKLRQTPKLDMIFTKTNDHHYNLTSMSRISCLSRLE